MSSDDEEEWKELQDELGKYSEEGYSFGNFYIESHGDYDDNSFRIGSSSIETDNYDKTIGLRDFFEGHNVFIFGCHVGGGYDPDNGSRFTQSLSDLWGATVFSNRSWTRSVYPFGGESLSSSDFNGIDCHNSPNACSESLRNTWLMATPNGSNPETIKNLRILGNAFSPLINNYFYD